MLKNIEIKENKEPTAARIINNKRKRKIDPPTEERLPPAKGKTDNPSPKKRKIAIKQPFTTPKPIETFLSNFNFRPKIKVIEQDQPVPTTPPPKKLDEKETFLSKFNRSKFIFEPAKEKKEPKKKIKKKIEENKENENLQFKRNFTTPKSNLMKEKEPQVDPESNNKDKDTLLLNDSLEKKMRIEQCELMGKVEPQTPVTRSSNTNPTKSVIPKTVPK